MIITPQYKELEVLLLAELKKRPALKRLFEDQEQSVIRNYLIPSLMQYQDKAQWKVLVPNTLHYFEREVLKAGCYDLKALETAAAGSLSLINSGSNTESSDIYCQLDSARVQEALDEPNATYLGTEELRQCIADLLDQTSPEALYEQRYGHFKRSLKQLGLSRFFPTVMNILLIILHLFNSLN